jgi:hypothetical protein
MSKNLVGTSLCCGHFFPICKRKEFKFFKLLENFIKENANAPSSTLESGINVAPGKFGKKNKRSPIYTLNLYLHLSQQIRSSILY